MRLTLAESARVSGGRDKLVDLQALDCGVPLLLAHPGSLR